MNRRDLIAIYLLTLLARIAVAAFQAQPGYMDAYYYTVGAQRLAQGYRFPQPSLLDAPPVDRRRAPDSHIGADLPRGPDSFCPAVRRTAADRLRDCVARDVAAARGVDRRAAHGLQRILSAVLGRARELHDVCCSRLAGAAPGRRGEIEGGGVRGGRVRQR